MDALEGLPPAPASGPGIADLPDAALAALLSTTTSLFDPSSSSQTGTPSVVAWAAAATSSAAATVTGSGAPGTKDSVLKSIAAMEIPSPDLDPDSCQLLGPFALLIQALMGVIVLGSLLVKRQRERPRRKLRIWTADVSKQVIGQLFVHFLNLFISSSIASLPAGGNPCALYFINILVDTTVGVFLVYLALRLVTHVLSVTLGLPLSSLGLVSGFYPSPFLHSWSRQLAVYLAALALMKLAVVLLFLIGGDALVKLGDGIIETISSDPKVQVLVAVMIGPIILNVVQFLLIDSLIKGKGENLPPELLETDDEGGGGDEEARHGFLRGRDGSDDEDDSDGEGKPDRRKSFHGRRPGLNTNGSATSNGSRKPSSNWFGKLTPGATGSAAADDGPHSYPPTSTSRRSEEKASPRSAAADLAGEGEGWDDETWDDWNDDPSSHPHSVGDPSRSPVALPSTDPPSIGTSPVVKQVHPWPPTSGLGATGAVGIGEKDDDFTVGSPGTPRIVVTEAF